MFLQNCIIKMFGMCGFVRFGNRSWIGMPFNPTNDSFSVHEERNHSYKKDKDDIDFDFSNKLSVV